MYENDVSDAMETMTAILRGCKVSVFWLRIVMQDAVSRIFHIHLFLQAMIMDLPERTESVKTLLTAEVPKGGKEGKNKLEVSNPVPQAKA